MFIFDKVIFLTAISNAILACLRLCGFARLFGQSKARPIDSFSSKGFSISIRHTYYPSSSFLPIESAVRMKFFWVPLLLILPLVVFLQLAPHFESAPIGENALELIGRYKRAQADKEVRRIRKYRSKGKNENGKRWEREHSLEEHQDRHGRTLRKRKRQRDEDEEFSEEEHEHHHERKLPRNNTDDSPKKGMSNSKLFGKIAKYGLTAASAFTLGRANAVMQNQQPFYTQPFMPPAAPIVPFPMVAQPAPIIQPFGFGLQCNGIFCY